MYNIIVVTVRRMSNNIIIVLYNMYIYKCDGII